MLELSMRVDMAAEAASLAAKPKWDAKRDHKAVASPAHRPAKLAVAPPSNGAASSNARWQGTSRGQHHRGQHHARGQGTGSGRRPSRSPPWHRKREPASRPELMLTSGPQADRTQTHSAPTGRSGPGQGVTSVSEKASGEEPGSSSGPEKASEQPLERLAAVAFAGDLFRDVSHRSGDTVDGSSSDRSEFARRGPVGDRSGSRAQSQAAHTKDAAESLEARRTRHRKSRRHEGKPRR